MVTDKQLEANQENAQLGGVKTVEGKAVSRFNALTHGILRESITEYEQGFYTELLQDLSDHYQPKNIVENILIERIAICYLKLFRTGRAETEFMKASLKPRHVPLRFEMDTEDPDGYEAKISDSHIEKLTNIYSRYETTLENRLFRAIHELERTQRARTGEKIALPLTVDINQVGSFSETNKNL